jgi:dipeptidyl aminopeptidase/acylaminoacyl peptidase
MKTRTFCLITLAVLLAGGSTVLEAAVLTPFDVARTRSVREAAVSPDGRLIAYVLEVPRQPLTEDNGPAWAELHVTDPAGQSHTYVGGKVNVSRVAWTPDGRNICFLAKRGDDKRTALYAIPHDGGEARRIVEHVTDITGYDWSADGRLLAFLASQEEPKTEREAREKGFNAEVFEENPRPVKVWIFEPERKESKPRALDLPGSASDLHWSPVDGRLALGLAPTSLIDDDYMNKRVRVIDSETGRITAEVANPGKLGRIVWSPDGRFLAMDSAADINDPSTGRLMLVESTGGTPRDLLPGWAGHLQDLDWKDNGNLVALTHEGVEAAVEEINTATGSRRPLVAHGTRAWRALSWSKSGVGAILGDSPQHPPEVFLLASGDASPKRLTDSNPWLANIEFAKQEVVSYRAKDGLELEGLLIRPLNEQPGRRYPLILTVHGGPEAHYSNGWLTGYSNPGQVAAAQGFAVFYPNYRGSTGRGVEFSKVSQGDPGGKEFDDLVDAVDHLVATGLVDQAKVGITGGSYGGYAAAWGATYYSERFAAAVMFVGISERIAKLGSTDIPQEMYLVHDRIWPWEKWELMLERSPVYHVEKARTPILILHGKDDPRVHPSQSLILYRYLKNLGQVPVRLILYPGEGHGNRRAAARLDYNLRMLRWMDHYLKGPGGEPPPPEIAYEEK